MGRNPTVFPHAFGIRPRTAHQAPGPSPIPIPLRPLRTFPAESARFRRPLCCRIRARRHGATAVAARSFDRTQSAVNGIRPAIAFVPRGDSMAGSRPVSPRRPEGQQGWKSFTPCRQAMPGGIAPLRNCMAGRGPAPRIRPAAQGTPKATGGKRSGHPEQRTSERKLTKCQTAEAICCVPNPR